VIRLIIDTDTAGDDCVSLLVALRSPNIQVEAITINCGNVAFDQEVENALYTLQVAGYGGKIPVYPGSRQPLLFPHQTVEYIHGRDGMGDSFFPRAAQRPEQEHAVEALVRLINANPGELTILAQAPLTNLALAVRLDPSIAGRVKHLWVMGGTNNALGNVTPAAEYNIWVDPEAAKIVFGAGFPLTMVGWDISIRHSVIDAAGLAAIEALDTPLSHFYMDLSRTARRFAVEQQGTAGPTHPDSIVAAMIADPEIMTESGEYFVDVETQGALTRGYTAVDLLRSSGKPANARVCLKADGERFRTLLMSVLNG
jgi:inosine-uridine nucleoside N-ribohydrolase